MTVDFLSLNLSERISMSLPRKLSVTGAVVELNYLSQNFVLGFLITCKNFNFYGMWDVKIL